MAGSGDARQRISPSAPVLKADVATPDGLVLGWAYVPGGTSPCLVQILHRRALLGEARASAFRADLLRAGFGHGHYAYAARLRTPLRAGPATLTLQLAAGGLRVAERVVAPRPQPVAPYTVERLLEPPAAWTGADIVASPACLPWGEYLACMGVPRFIDAAFHFALKRWPSAAEISVHTRGLSRGTLTAESLALRLLGSRECADLPGLVSPYDPAFLFENRSGSSGLLPRAS